MHAASGIRAGHYSGPQSHVTLEISIPIYLPLLSLPVLRSVLLHQHHIYHYEPFQVKSNSNSHNWKKWCKAETVSLYSATTTIVTPDTYAQAQAQVQVAYRASWLATHDRCIAQPSSHEKESESGNC